MRHELVVEIIEKLDAIDFYDRVMFEAGLCTSEVIHNMDVQDKLLRNLQRIDLDAYLCYICGERETIEKYYSRKVEQNASADIPN